MRLWTAFLATTLPACGFQAEAMIDAPPPDAAQLMYGTYIPISFNATQDLPSEPRTIAGPLDIDTNSTDSAICDQHVNQKGDYCVFVGKGFTVMSGAKISAHGVKPLVLLSTSTFQLDGEIDVSSRLSPAQVGAGADPTTSGGCVLGVTATGATGGAGGSYREQGGLGSDAVPAGQSGAVQGMPGPKFSEFPSRLRGGCPGGDGAGALGNQGRGGHGGGAVAILAAQITLNGRINASGSGGHGGAAGPAGAGGGGSGGMIVLDSSMIQLGASARIWANGGSGAQGGTDGNGGGTGGDRTGGDGTESAGPNQHAVAPTHNAMLNGCSGGDGSLGANGGASGIGDAVSTGGDNGGGGGGGGGGAGFIRGPMTTDPAVISPPPSNP